MALKHIKNKIKSTERTSKVTKAMEAVSVVKMRKSQERALSGRPYAEAAFRIIQNIAGSFEVKDSAFLRENQGSHDCVIVVTSDKGLAGSLNAAVLKEANNIIRELSQESVELICFGKKAYEHFSRRGYTVPRHYLNVSDNIALNDVEEVVDFVVSQFVSGKYKKVRVVFQNFISTFEQSALVRQVLPVSQAEVRLMIDDIIPKQGKYSAAEKYEETMISYITEQEHAKLFDTIFTILVGVMVYHALLESKASEHSARMVAMKNATDKANEVAHALTLLFNKERQSVITAEVSEITGGIEAMKNK